MSHKRIIGNGMFSQKNAFPIRSRDNNRSLRFSVRSTWVVCSNFSYIDTKNVTQTKGNAIMDNERLARFLLTFFLGWIGSIIINHTSLKPEGYTSRTLAYVFLTLVTFGIYQIVASICNLTFDPSKPRNIGYSKD